MEVETTTITKILTTYPYSDMFHSRVWKWKAAADTNDN